MAKNDPWIVRRTAVDEPDAGESGTIYEYEIRHDGRTVFTTLDSEDAYDTVACLNLLPDAIQAIEGCRSHLKACEAGKIAHPFQSASLVLASAVVSRYERIRSER